MRPAASPTRRNTRWSRSAGRVRDDGPLRDDANRGAGLQ
jgi:hypothetical protein